MCFFLAEGFRYTSSKRRYGERLLFGAVLSQLPFFLVFRLMTFNMMFTLLLCFLLLVVRTDDRFAGKRLVLGILIVFASGLCDWPVMALSSLCCSGTQGRTGSQKEGLLVCGHPVRSFYVCQRLRTSFKPCGGPDSYSPLLCRPCGGLPYHPVSL